MLSIRSTHTQVTPDLAKNILSGSAYEYQRGIDEKRVALWVNMMRRGAWMPDKEIKIVTCQGKQYLCNGQHRLSAVIQANTPQWFNMTTVDVDNIDDVAAIYNTEDMGKPRSFNDIVRTLDIPSLTGIPSRYVARAKAAIAYIDQDFGIVSLGQQDPWELADRIINEYADPINNYVESIGGARQGNDGRNLFSRVPVMALGLITYKESINKVGKQRVDDFWEGMAMDDGLRQGDPRKVALTHLQSTHLTNRSSKVTSGAAISANVQSRYLANCWNAYAQGKEYKADTKRAGSKVFDPRSPIVIYGSSYTGNR